MDINKRDIRSLINCDFRAINDGSGPPKLVGYAAKFDSLSEDFGGYREIIRKGAFSNWLADPRNEVKFYSEHRTATGVLGRRSMGTLKVWEDNIGLAFECVPPDTQIARDLMAMVAPDRRDITGMSFGFYHDRDNESWIEGDDGEPVIEIRSVKEIFEISPTCEPCYPETDIALRSLAEWKASKATPIITTPYALLKAKLMLAERNLSL